MDIRIGVVQHVLLQAKLKEKVSQNRGITTHDDDDEDTYNFKGSFQLNHITFMNVHLRFVCRIVCIISDWLLQTYFFII